MTGRWRLIRSGPADPFTNMALDEALLLEYPAHSRIPTLRIYGWEPAALSLGFSQDAREELDIGYCRRTGLNFVRRLTGGGIIAHGNELTYSLVCSREDLGITPHIASSYKKTCSFLIEFYRRLGLDAKFACDVILPDEKLGEPSPLCYAAKEKYDIVAGDAAPRKIGGNAQKRTREVIFQHGSIPITGVLPGNRFLRERRTVAVAATLAELVGPGVGSADLAGTLVDSFEAAFGVTAEEGRLSPAEEALAANLRDKKYMSEEWNCGRLDPLDVKEADESGAALVAE